MSVFARFYGRHVKVPYKDGIQFKIARGKLIQCGDGFVTVEGRLGVIIIAEKNVERMALVSDDEEV